MNLNGNPERYTNHDGYLQTGSYDVFAGLEVLNCDPVVVGLSMTYNRYDSAGKKLLRCEGIYSVSLISTIFTPAGVIGVTFPDTIEAAKQCRIDHDQAYQVSDRSVDIPTRQLGRTVGITNGPGALGPWRRKAARWRLSGFAE